ncbi:MAG TPA: RcpC/CpaB family pilus assembly protein [Solirubrobacteraceae bacterium]|jgi:Flp pilus assembly protein CpaB|nr:RcpC/CpaB family pilus assembly protein [Solirubrobacteraceae bacterium]
MNTPRILTPRRRGPEHRPDQNGGVPPKLRLREQPQAAAGVPPQAEGSPRRLRQPLLLAGVVLVLVALIGYWGVYSASTKRTPILVTTHALAAGAVLSSGDLRTAELAGDSSVLASLVPGRNLTQAIGRHLSTALSAGTPLPYGALASQQSQSSAMTLAVPEFDVAGASLQAGDVVTVLATFGAGSGQATTRPIARNLQIVSVGEVPPNSDPSTTTVPVTVTVSNPSIASSLALANEDAKLDLLLEGANASTAPIPQVSQASAP